MSPRMKRTTHYSKQEIIEILQRETTMIKIDINILADVLEDYTFLVLDDLYRALGIIRKGEVPNDK